MNGTPEPSCSTTGTCTLHLQQTRRNAGLSLEAIADHTKISVRFLRAIETEDFEKLPGGIYATSYLRQYAAAIGYDEAELLAYYERKSKPGLTLVTEPRAETPARSRLDRWLGTPATSLNIK